MDRNKLRAGLMKAASSDEEFDKYALSIDIENIKTFMYGVGTGMITLLLTSGILWLILGKG